MNRYRGTYRVVYEFDKYGNPCEFTYIPCNIKKGANIYRYSKNQLCIYIPSLRIANTLLKEYSSIFKEYIWGDFEAVLIFNESNIKDVESVLKIYKKGANISPKSKQNIRFKSAGEFPAKYFKEI
ncbi:MAG: hypothetical protein J6M02_02710 [Clostridia bacterium]|nr:hypothetical protein [Clostridia bacterium]